MLYLFLLGSLASHEFLHSSCWGPSLSGCLDNLVPAPSMHSATLPAVPGPATGGARPLCLMASNACVRFQAAIGCLGADTPLILFQPPPWAPSLSPSICSGIIPVVPSPTTGGAKRLCLARPGPRARTGTRARCQKGGQVPRFRLQASTTTARWAGRDNA